MRLPPAWLVVLSGVVIAMHVGKMPPAIPVLQQALGVTLVQAGFLPLLLAALPEGEAKERIGQAVEACVKRRLETKA